MRWPDRDAEGRFRIVCSCGKWEFTGTADEIHRASIGHDDAPWRQHVVTIMGRVDTATDETQHG